MKVLVAVENNSVGFDLCEFIANHKWEEGTHFRFVHVIDLSPFMYSIEVDNVAQMETHLTKKWEEHGQTFSQFVKNGKPGLDADYKLLCGDAARCLIDESKQWRPDLILMGTHGNPDGGLFWPRSTSAAVMRSVPCAVIVLKSEKTKGKLRDFSMLSAKA
jgi:nucleotide-binding universal stress UspA family protein